MSVLQEIPNIKIPYPTEGIIRTAQLDDTVAPVNSVQLAVNMNFDRVGAIQTRPGTTQYADDLVDAINNYGTLRNSILVPGFQSIFQYGETTEIVATDFSDPTAVKISNTKIAVFWKGVDGDGFCRNFTIDQDTGEITPIGTALEFDSGNASNMVGVLVGTDRVLLIWTGSSNDAIARIFNTNADSIVAVGSGVTFDSGEGSDFGVAIVDSTHAIVFYTDASIQGIATILAFNTTSGVITEPGSPLTFDAVFNIDNSSVAIGDGIHFLNFWSGTSGGNAQVFSVNTGTWAITALGSVLNYDSLNADNNAMTTGDGEHFVNVHRGTGGYRAQAFEVNTGTWAVTAVGNSVVIDAGGGNDLYAVAFSDGEHFVAFYSENIGDGSVQLLEMEPGTFNMSLVGAPLTGYDFANTQYTTAVVVGTNKVISVWGVEDFDHGNAAFFETIGAPVDGKWLYAASGDSVFNTDNTTWVSRRSGLAQVSKARFSQYLNYIWMVNGNDLIGGDPVATSNGGNFGTDLVPDSFPKGDFIHAGFEGRVWVANKTIGIVYYTDIVQFSPPNTYTLSYNPEVNFISTLSPETGQTFTALFRVPRALLVFTEDTITRIYGASSVDAYPAYNVGTFSQESIIETKTGIFFHHSSGFYQFDYGSQPVEISRRIIDFVKAIPRANYEDIVGIYDGFDCVKWYVGSVLVEGVIFSNCMVRYTISTQVWTIYDYKGIDITALISYDDGEAINQIVGGEFDEDIKTGTLDTGTTDYGQEFYYEFIDRWRSFSDMYYQTKSMDGFNVYSENAAGANLSYQKQKSGPNAWLPIGTVTEQNNSLMPNSGTEDFDVMRIRLAGNTKGTQVVVHGIEIISLTIKGQDQN